MIEPHTVAFDEIEAGMVRQWDYAITRQVYEGFMAAFDDRSPVHVDEGFARARGFEGRVMHGAILNGFVSHFVGMVFPGVQSLLLSTDLRFSKPSYAEDLLRLEARVMHKLESEKVILLDVTFTNLTRSWLAARGRVQVMVGRSV